MQDLEKDHEHRLTDEQSEVREEMIKLQNKIMMEVVSSVCLILRTKEGCEHWGILFAEMYITMTYITCKCLLFPSLKQQQQELATVQTSLQFLLSR